MASQAQELGCIKFSTNTPTQTSAQMVLPAGSANNFSTMLSTYGPRGHRSLWHTVLARAGKDGHMVLVRQNFDTHIWKATAFAVNHAYRNVAVSSYTVTIRVRDQSNKPVNHAKVNLSASAAVDLIMNNAHITMTTAQTTLVADNNGDLTFIIPTDSLGSSVIRIHGYTTRDGMTTDFESVVNVRPSDKVFSKLADKIKSPTDLKNAKGASGQSVWSDPSAITDKDWDTAHDTIKELIVAHSKLPSNGDKVQPAVTTLATVSIKSFGVFQELSNDWDKVNTWLHEKADQLKNLAVKVVGKFQCLRPASTCKLNHVDRGCMALYMRDWRKVVGTCHRCHRESRSSSPYCSVQTQSSLEGCG